MTGYECGVFTCIYANFLGNNMKMSFTQEHISRCRNLMALSILQADLGKPIVSGYKLQVMETASKSFDKKEDIIMKNVNQKPKMSQNEKLMFHVKRFFDISG